jgi:hypothetical protein
VPDERLETALDVMPDMVFEPAFVEVDQERKVPFLSVALSLFGAYTFGDARCDLRLGSSKKKVEPLPSSDSSQMLPPIRSTSSLQI